MSTTSIAARPPRVKQPGVYSITNTVTGRIYVGGTRHIPTRWSQHRTSLANGTHHNLRLQADYATYGPDAFTYAVIEACSADQLADREQFWMHTLDSDRTGYNVYPALGEITRGARGPYDRTTNPAGAATAWARVFEKGGTP